MYAKRAFVLYVGEDGGGKASLRGHVEDMAASEKKNYEEVGGWILLKGEVRKERNTNYPSLSLASAACRVLQDSAQLS